MRLDRRTLLGVLPLVPFITVERSAAASGGPVRIVVPAGPGSTPDIQARLIGNELGKDLGQSIVVENVSGGAGILGVQRVTRSPADGQTLLWGFGQLVTINPTMYVKLPYSADDLLPLGQIARGGYVLLGRKDLPVNDVRGLIEYSKANPGKLSYASSGVGSFAHLGIELLRQRYGLDATHIPYGVGTAGNVDLIAGRIDFRLEPPSSAIAMVKDGVVKPLGVTTAKRFAALPNVPTLEESLPGFTITTWVGVLAPKGIPDDVARRLTATLATISERPDIRQRFTEIGMDPEWSPPDQLSQTIRRETAEWGDVIRKAGIQISE